MPAILPVFPPAFRFVAFVLVAILAALSVTVTVAPAPVRAVPAEVGYRDFAYNDPSAAGADDVTNDRTQSKLWYANGIWWGVMFNNAKPTDQKFRIHRLNMATQVWSTTPTIVDERNRSHADALWTGAKLYVVSAHRTDQLRVLRFSLNTATNAWTVDAGFPKTIPSGAGVVTAVQYATIARDSTGVLWLAWNQAGRIMLSTSSNDAVNWSAPFQLPVQGNDMIPEDVVALTSIGSPASGIGVVWGNQAVTDDAFYFAAHVDGQAPGMWQARETIEGGPGTFTADDHVSVKTDSAGRLVAVLKTNRDLKSGGSSEPQTMVVRRTGLPNVAGTWTKHTVSLVSHDVTRPILVLDGAANQANVFQTSPTGGGIIYRRTASLTTLDFGTASRGSAFIQSSLDPTVNDPTSTKQVVPAGAGLIVIASDIATRRYLHNCVGGPCPVRPTGAFSATPTSGEGPLNVSFTDQSTGTPTSWSWSFGDGGTSTERNPVHAYNPGTYTVSLTVANTAGSDVETKTNHITVTVPNGARFYPMSPTRLLDTRTGNGLTGVFQHGVPREIQITGRAGIPSDAKAVTANLTVTNQTRPGYVFLGPAPVPAVPASSTLNFPTSDVRANGVTVALNTSGKLGAVYRAASGATTHLVLDVTGYFRQDASGATYIPLPPTRILDTRHANGLSGPFLHAVPRDFQVTGRGGVPAGAIAVTGNLTVTNQTKPGFVSLGPAPVPVSPAFSTLNFPTGEARANNAVVPLSGSGRLGAVYRGGTGSSAHLVFDVTGYFVQSGAGADYFPLAPTRLLDSRWGNGLSGPFAQGVPRAWSVEGRAGIPTTATAVTGNLTVTNQTSPGYVSLGPAPVPANPTFSTLNFPVGEARANGAAVPTSSGGDLGAVYRAGSGATTHLVFDVTGYFEP